ncbi:MAG: hypothetical protein NWP83_01420, partial [Spirosomaceae bacterium]|nr:hypothetical protein [Spirosomataceae bacterium]
MKTTSENNFEQQWKRKFENASVPPPSDMWDRIEADLDEQKKRTPFFLLWGLPAFVTSGIAATLILTLGGWFLLKNTEESTSAKVVKVLESSSEEVILEESVAEPFKTEPQKAVISKKVITKTVPISTNKNTLSELAKLKSNTTGFAQLMNEIILEEPKAGKITSQINPTFLENIADNLKEIVPHQFTELPVRYILKRNKLAYNEPIINEETKEKRRSWIGLISGISPFKPNFQNGGLNNLASANAASFSANDANFTIQRVPNGVSGSNSSDMENAFGIPTGSPVQQFNNGRAFNFGIQAGKRLTERLAFESGIRYIQGNSPVNSNVYTLNRSTGEINPFVQD